jgi:hypothetical protein
VSTHAANEVSHQPAKDRKEQVVDLVVIPDHYGKKLVVRDCSYLYSFLSCPAACANELGIIAIAGLVRFVSDVASGSYVRSWICDDSQGIETIAMITSNKDCGGPVEPVAESFRGL